MIYCNKVLPLGIINNKQRSTGDVIMTATDVTSSSSSVALLIHTDMKETIPVRLVLDCAARVKQHQCFKTKRCFVLMRHQSQYMPDAVHTVLAAFHNLQPLVADLFVVNVAHT